MKSTSQLSVGLVQEARGEMGPPADKGLVNSIYIEGTLAELDNPGEFMHDVAAAKLVRARTACVCCPCLFPCPQRREKALPYAEWVNAAFAVLDTQWD